MKVLRGIFLVSLITVCAFAANNEKKVSPEEVKVGKGDKHVDMVVWYEIQADWRKKPADFMYGCVPSVVLDKDENVWVGTRTEQPIQLYSSDGKFIRSFGEGLINEMHYMTVDRQGYIWAVNCGGHAVHKFTPEGELLMTLGTLDEIGGDEKHFNWPTDVEIAANGDIFVSDGYGNSRVVHFDSKGKFIKTWGRFGQGPGEFDIPHAIAIDSTGRIYVTDRNNARVQVFEQSGKFIAQWRNLLVPWGICITENDEIWVCGSSPMIWKDNLENLSCPPKDQVIMRFDRDGKVQQLWTLPKYPNPKKFSVKDMGKFTAPAKKPWTKPGEVDWLHGIAVDSKGNIYTGDIFGKRVQKFVRHTDPKAPRP